MSNPYVPPTLSGYNSNPPPNDGTEDPSNQLDWAKHIDKIGDPLKLFAQAMNNNISDAFDKTFGAAPVAKLNDYTVVESDQGKFLLISGATTVTLLSAADAGSGFPLIIVNINVGTEIVTVEPAAGDLLNFKSSVELPPFEGMIITSNGAHWFGLITNNYSTGTFTPVYNGFSADPTGDVSWAISNNVATLRFPADDGTSDSSLFTITNLPDALVPNATKRIPIAHLQDSGAFVSASINLPASGVSTILVFEADGDSAGWTASGAKGFGTSFVAVTYLLRDF